MAYRDDVEALEARLRGLDADLVQQTRERDELARLLADAKARADYAAGRFGVTVRDAARRRERWRWRSLGLAALAAAVASVYAASVAVPVDHSRDHTRIDRFLPDYLESVREVCRCNDARCAHQRNFEVRLYFGPPYGVAIERDLDPASAARIRGINALRESCMAQQARRSP